MNLEQLQSMSDDELNKSAAIHFLWGGIANTPSDDWKPTTDMNDAMRMWSLLHNEGWELNLSCDQKVTLPWDCRMFYKEQKRFIAHEKTEPRAITIAALLAKTIQ